jgi:hypothetical protein
MTDAPLTPAQEAEAQRLFELMQKPFLDEARKLARLLAARPDHQLLGQTEFEVRDAVHRLGAKALEAALDERKKGGTKGRA